MHWSVFSNVAYTNRGRCLEMNDGGELIQRVNGLEGGLAMTLDTLTDHYLPESVQPAVLKLLSSQIKRAYLTFSDYSRRFI